MTMVVLLLPWFVAHGAHMPPAHAIAAPLRSLAALGAALLILIVTGLRRGAAAPGHLLRFWLCCFCFSTASARSSAFPAFLPPSTSFICSTAPIPRGRWRTSWRPSLPPDETVAVFRVRRDIEYGLSFYRNHEVVNYEESGVPDEQHMLVARVTGRNGVDLQTQCRARRISGGPPVRSSFSAGRNRGWKFISWER